MSLWITDLLQKCSCNMLFGAVRNYRKVYATAINPPLPQNI